MFIFPQMWALGLKQPQFEKCSGKDYKAFHSPSTVYKLYWIDKEIWNSF